VEDDVAGRKGESQRREQSQRNPARGTKEQLEQAPPLPGEQERHEGGDPCGSVGRWTERTGPGSGHGPCTAHTWWSTQSPACGVSTTVVSPSETGSSTAASRQPSAAEKCKGPRSDSFDRAPFTETRTSISCSGAVRAMSLVDFPGGSVIRNSSERPGG